MIANNLGAPRLARLLLWLALAVPAALGGEAKDRPDAGAVAATNGDDCPPLLREVLRVPRDNAARQERLVELLQQGGAAREEILLTPVRGAGRGDRNVLALLPGTEPAAGIIVIGAHTDTVPGSQGAVDNWSGTVMLAALYQRFRPVTVRHTLVFVGFASEEHAREGSSQFVRRLDRKTRRNLRAMVNLECLGVKEPRTWVNRSADKLEALFAEAGKATGVPFKRQVLFGYRTDAFSFDRAGIPAITIHSLDPRGLTCINNPKDRIGLIDFAQYAATFRLLAAYLEALDRHDRPISARDRERRLKPVLKSLWRAAADTEDGVVVRAPLGRTPEGRAGLRPEDKLLQIGDAPVANRQELLTALLTLHRGQTVEMTLQRREGKDQKTFKVKVSY